MKKIAYLCLIIVIAVFTASCQSAETTVPEATSSATSETAKVNVSPTEKTYQFNSCEAFKSSVMGENREEFLKTVEEEAPALLALLSMLAENETILTPTRDGKDVLLLRDSKRYIYLFEKEFYNSPMILYHCDYNGIHVRVRVSFEALYAHDSNEELDITSFMRKFAPTYPSPDNYKDKEGVIFTEDKAITVNAETVLARIVDYEQSYYYDRIQYLHNGLIVCIEAPDLAEFYEEFFEGFTIT